VLASEHPDTPGTSGAPKLSSVLGRGWFVIHRSATDG
jgi:hypothetical protein